MASAWLVLAAGSARQHGGNDGYKDEPAESYSWDDTVPNHAAIARGDAIVLWDKKALIGASVIDQIDEGTDTKPVYRCSLCGAAHIKRRKTLEPPWRCFNCNRNFDQPLIERKGVHTYVSRHEVAWVDLDGLLTGARLRELCVKPKSQLSMRNLRWPEFRTAIDDAGQRSALATLDARAKQLIGGHVDATVRVRLGQGTFRNQLLAAYGAVCAITGPAPASTLEAGHLYSYANVGEHHRHGGLLLRRDVHRLFDMGQIAVHPESLVIDVTPEVASFATYAAVNRRRLSVAVNNDQRRWLARHWAQHRAVA